ncbi:hypothetical protein N9852_01005 [Alphaproteobacteria bacterium]|nr:hypothetical protein [Alphaproteobacteria bacterium]
MKKTYIIAVIFLLLTSCVTTRQINTSDACDIFKAYPQWLIITEKTKEKWGVPVTLQLAFIKQESSFQKNAKPPRNKLLGVIPGKRMSSAYGYSQALDGTWEDYKSSTGNYGASRKNFRDASDFIGWYVDGSHRLLKLPKNDVLNHYLAYHEGRGGFQKKTYNNKKWLLNVAKKVQNQAAIFSKQIKSCKLSKNKNSVL